MDLFYTSPMLLFTYSSWFASIAQISSPYFPLTLQFCVFPLFLGRYVHIVMSGVSHRVVEHLRAAGFLTWFSLLPHENKLSVLNFNVQRVAEYAEPIKSKEELIFMVSYVVESVFISSRYEVIQTK